MDEGIDILEKEIDRLVRANQKLEKQLGCPGVDHAAIAAAMTDNVRLIAEIQGALR